MRKRNVDKMEKRKIVVIMIIRNVRIVMWKSSKGGPVQRKVAMLFNNMFVQLFNSDLFGAHLTVLARMLQSKRLFNSRYTCSFYPIQLEWSTPYISFKPLLYIQCYFTAYSTPMARSEPHTVYHRCEFVTKHSNTYMPLAKLSSSLQLNARSPRTCRYRSSWCSWLCSTSTRS